MAGVQKRHEFAASTADAPRSLGRYRIEAVLGRGGVGAVYRAYDETSGERVALKTLELQRPHAQALFEREYQTLASIAHPAVVRTFDYGVTEDGNRYYTMELIEGDDLYALTPMPWRALCVHLRTIAEALALLHARGLVHRDVSPRNIRIDRKGQARLLDFGALAQFGPITEVVGTPACIAPEAVGGGVIDGRSDLFSLGATAYIALSGQKPYALGTWEDAAAAFSVPPQPLLEYMPEMPVALSDMIVRLLQVDPAHRPDSAADVIEHLSALDGALEARESDAPTPQLASTALIGREREVEQLREHLRHAFQGHGTAVVIEGASGIGKSRLAQQLLVDARVLGAVAVRAEGGTKQLFAGAHHQIMRALLTAAPADTEACLAQEPLAAAWLDAVQRETFEQPRRDATGTQLGAVVRCVRALSQRRVLVIVVEDAQVLDAASIATLFSLAHGIEALRIVLVLTLRDDAAVDPTLERVVRICSQIKLRRLSASAVDALVASIFGPVDHRARLSSWIESLGGGNPGHSLDLLEALVRKGIVRRLSGSWSIPGELPQQQLPASLEDALRAVLETLEEAALELAQLMALHNGSMPIELCHELRKPCSEQEVRALVDRLVAERVVSEGPAGYRVAHDGWRKALLSSVSDSRRVLLHRALADALLSESGEQAAAVAALSARLQAGWHLLHGGAVARGRQLLLDAGIQLTRHGEGLADAVPALESALLAFGRDPDSRYARLGLMVPLTAAGAYLDWRLTYKYGLPVLAGLTEATGLDLAAALAKLLPRRIALFSALGFGALRMPLTGRRTIARDYRELFLGLIGLSGAALGSFASLADKASAERVIERLQPLAWFPERHPAAVAYALHRALAAVAAGRHADAYEEARRVQALLEHPDVVRSFPDDARRQFVVGLHVLIGTIDAYRADKRVMSSIEALEREGTAAAQESIAGFRANYYANRGEMALHKSAREELDVLAAHGGSPWRQDVLLPRCLWWVQAQCEDALGLKRSIRQLEPFSRDCEGLVSTYAAAHGCYLAERGLATEALERYGPTLSAAVRDCPILLARVAAAYARILRSAGQAQAALDTCQRTLARFGPAEREIVCFVHGLELELGLALAATGDVTSAATYLSQLCSAQAVHDNPLLHALSHIARADVAVLQADRAAYAEHAAQAQHWVALTQYAALFGLVQRLRGRARAAGLTRDVSLAPRASKAAEKRGENSVGSAIAACRGDVERQQLALDILIEQTRAASGYLYLFGAAGLRLVAPQHGAEPPDVLQEELEARVRSWHELDSEATVADGCEPLQTLVGGDARRDPIGGLEAKLGSPYRVVMLALPNSRSQRLVGVAALIEGAQPLLAMSAPISEAVAQGIYQAGDATVMR